MAILTIPTKTKSDLSRLFLGILEDQMDPYQQDETLSLESFGQEGNFGVKKDGADLVRTASKLILKDQKLNRCVSEDCVHSWITDTIMKLINDGHPQNLNLYIDSMYDELLEKVEFLKIYVPLLGINAETNTFRLGNIIITKVSEHDLAEFEKCFELAAQENCSSINHEEDPIELHRHWVDQAISNQTCATFLVKAEHTKALERAIYETRQAIHILDLLLGLIDCDSKETKIGIRGDFFDDTRIIPGLSLRTPGYSITQDALGPSMDLFINPATIELFNKSGLLKASQLLKKRTLSELEVVLINAMSWFSIAQKIHDKETAFLKLYSTIEMLKPQEGISFHRFVSIVLANDKQTRESINSFSEKVLQKLRGAVSHKGLNKVFDADLALINRIALAIILIFLGQTENIQTSIGIEKWLEELSEPETCDQDYLDHWPIRAVVHSIESLVL